MDGDLIALASVTEWGTKNIVYTNDQGVFAIRLNLAKRKVKVICSYNGFENDTAWVDENTTYLNFKLNQNYLVIKEVVISASRKREFKFESPATVETLDPKMLLYNAGTSANDRITNLAGVDAITTILNFKVINTRGFNAAYNRRFIQRYDNTELGLPGFSTALVQMNGPIDLLAINEHGLRASSIVKNMLEHSRKGSGERKSISINDICSEYIKLSFQSAKANFPEFQCEISQNLDATIPNLNVVRQDISRVLLNLFNNALYAVAENKKPWLPIINPMYR